MKYEKQLRELQLKCLDILKVVHSICIKYNIQYSLCGGSVIGAHLYKGFIPWDDDIDLMMTRENYNKFLKVVSKELPKKYKLEHYSSSQSASVMFSKIVDKSTTVIEHDIFYGLRKTGVFIDITVYDSIPNNIVKSCFLKMSRFCYLYLKRKEYSRNREYHHRFLLKIVQFIPPMIGRKMLHFIEKILSSFKPKKNYYWYELFSCGKENLAYPFEIFSDYTFILFENEFFMIVRDYVHYLEICYNRTNFEIPKVQQIPHHYEFVDLNNPYENYEM